MSEDVLRQLLTAIDTVTARSLLEDLQDEAKRTPQLYNAVGKFLERHKFTIAKLQPNASLLGDLSAALDDVQKLTDEELYGPGETHH